MNKFKYWIPEHGGSVNDYYEFETSWDKDNLEHVAEEAAGHFHNDHDGWVCEWPLKIAIADENGLLAVFSVEREQEPVFSACEIPRTPEG